jgi:hypothetical protein
MVKTEVEGAAAGRERISLKLVGDKYPTQYRWKKRDLQ